MFAGVISLLASSFSLCDNGVSLYPKALNQISKLDRVVGIGQSRKTRLWEMRTGREGSQTNCRLLPPFGVPLGTGQGLKADRDLRVLWLLR